MAFLIWTVLDGSVSSKPQEMDEVDKENLMKKAVELVNALHAAGSNIRQRNPSNNTRSLSRRRRHSEEEARDQIRLKVDPSSKYHHLEVPGIDRDQDQESRKGSGQRNIRKSSTTKPARRKPPPLERHMTLAIISLDGTPAVLREPISSSKTVWSRHGFVDRSNREGQVSRLDKHNQLSGSEELRVPQEFAGHRIQHSLSAKVVRSSSPNLDNFFSVTPTFRTTTDSKSDSEDEELNQDTLPTMRQPSHENLDVTDGGPRDSGCWPLSMLHDRPLLKLVLVMMINALLSLACAAAIIQIEYPEQKVFIRNVYD